MLAAAGNRVRRRRVAVSLLMLCAVLAVLAVIGAGAVPSKAAPSVAVSSRAVWSGAVPVGAAAGAGFSGAGFSAADGLAGGAPSSASSAESALPGAAVAAPTRGHGASAHRADVPRVGPGGPPRATGLLGVGAGTDLAAPLTLLAVAGALAVLARSSRVLAPARERAPPAPA